MPGVSFVPLPRLISQDDLLLWARQLVDSLQSIFIGSGVGQINGDSILDGSLVTSKLLATAGGIYNGTSVQYPIGTGQIIQMPNIWESSGGVVTFSNELQAPPFYGWGIVTLGGHFSDANAVGAVVTIQENDGGGYYDRISWNGGIPVDPNISLLLPMPANAKFRATITNTAVQNLQYVLFTLGSIGKVKQT
jgi:hypothetical protein